MFLLTFAGCVFMYVSGRVRFRCSLVKASQGREAKAVTPQASDDLRKIKAEVLGDFRPSGALSGPLERQKTTQDEKPGLGKGSGPLETAY